MVRNRGQQRPAAEQQSAREPSKSLQQNSVHDVAISKQCACLMTVWRGRRLTLGACQATSPRAFAQAQTKGMLKRYRSRGNVGWIDEGVISGSGSHLTLTSHFQDRLARSCIQVLPVSEGHNPEHPDSKQTEKTKSCQRPCIHWHIAHSVSTPPSILFLYY